MHTKTPQQTVLVIDDEDAIRAGVRLILEDAGYAVLDARNGREGLNALSAAAAPLVVLLDLMMPDMSGVQLLHVLAEEPSLAERHAFIIFSAARAFRAETLVFYLPGRRLFEVPKPFRIDDLVMTVTQATETLVRSTIAS